MRIFVSGTASAAVRWSGLSIALFLFASLSTAQETPTVEMVEANALSARREIRSGEMILRIEGSAITDSIETLRRSRQHVWFDLPRVRVDEEVEAAENGDGKVSAKTTVQCLGCYSDNTILDYSEQSDDPGTRHAFLTDLQHRKRQPDGSVGPPPRQPPNPWLIGFAPVGYRDTTAEIPLDAFIGRAGRSSASIASADVDGRRCWRITYDRKVGNREAHVSIDIAPDEGWSVARLSETTDLHGARDVRVVECLNGEVAGGSVWFPTKMTFERRLDDTVVLRETAEIQVVAINNESVREAFALSRIPAFREGTPVTRQPWHGDPAFPRLTAVWNGSKLIPDLKPAATPRGAPVASSPATPASRKSKPPAMSDPADEPAAEEDPEPERTSWAMLINVVGVIVIIVGIVGYRFMRR